MRRTIRGRGARGFSDYHVDAFPAADVGGTWKDFNRGRNKLWRGGYRVLYTATSRGPLLCLWRPADE